MLKVISDNILYNELSNNSRQMIVSRYNQLIVWKFILEEYRTFGK